ncbi:DivIVA domain-containing protein [Actinoplanes sp. NPDC051851]|uniref:DivIVA domain-containing protein n=1 Tax=Actinoplanes sp. NPDC051851 TaxID=3154753 RepID=UPI00343FB1EB
MSSQGQRFRRRALRRGYKVDEVDAFLDRVEATLAGEQVGPPVGAQEVHDVVFRVRFGGYDEWQVDLHLDRVERQLAEFEERGGRPVDPMRDSMRGGLTATPAGPPSGPPPGMQQGPPPGMGGPPPGMGPGGMGPGGMGPGGMPRDRMAGAGMGAAGMGGPPPGMQQGPPPGMGGPQQMGGPGMAPPTERIQLPPRGEDPRMMPPQMPQRQQMQQPPQPDPYGGRYDEPTGYAQRPELPQRPAPQPPNPYEQQQNPYDQGGYDGFEAGRHGKTDMTAEIQMPRDPRMDPRGGYGQPPMGGGPMPGSPVPGSPMSGPPGYGPPPQQQQQQAAPPMGEPGGELYRVDQLRRTFQPRRFGSGYDPMQVDRLFEGILNAMTGRGPMPVNENDLDMLQFGLVPNGYFEAEVDAALREVKDILLRRR